MIPWASMLLLSSLLLSITLSSQTPSAPPKLSPQAAYDEVTRPLEITRRSIGNWSDSETTALAVAMKQAADACGARTSDTLSDDELIAYARLCSLGQQWPAVNTAATKYIAGEGPKPQLSQAYAFQINAVLHTNDVKAILASSQMMLQAVPYDSVVDETIHGALRYLQLVYMADALTLYSLREPILLLAMRTPRQPVTAPETAPSVALHSLYREGTAFASLQQFAGDSEGAAKTVAELDASLPAQLAPDDMIMIEQSRRQYALIGAPLPRIKLTLSLFSVGETPRINANYGASTVLFLFPDWCAQCVRMAQQFRTTLYRASEQDVHLYGLLAQAAPAVPAAPAPKKRPSGKDPAEVESPKTPAELLRGSPTLIVAPDTLAQFAANDFPLLIATDSKGIVRFIQPASDNALNAGDMLDQVTGQIARQWPQDRPGRAVLVPRSAQP